MLRERFGVKAINQLNAIKRIKKIVLNNPEKLHQSDWHSECGTSHCIAGWLCTLNEKARQLEEKTTTEFAGCALLSDYAHLFHKSDEEVLQFLQEVK